MRARSTPPDRARRRSPPAAGRGRARALLVAIALLPAAAAQAASPQPGEPAPATDGTPRSGAFQRSWSPRRILGPASAGHIAEILAPDEAVSYEYYVPEDYRPDRPAGVLVYISPTYSGAMPESWAPVLDVHNLIWIGANRSGNRQAVVRRKILALLAPYAVAKEYAVDFGRVYVAGFSGGAKTASRAAVDYARVFRGALFICGAEFWDVAEPAYIDEVRRNRYVFVTGTYDQALEPVREVFGRFERAGIDKLKLMVVREMTHRLPRRHDFAAAMRFLDPPAPD